MLRFGDRALLRGGIVPICCHEALLGEERARPREGDRARQEIMEWRRARNCEVLLEIGQTTCDQIW